MMGLASIMKQRQKGGKAYEVIKLLYSDKIINQSINASDYNININKFIKIYRAKWILTYIFGDKFRRSIVRPICNRQFLNICKKKDIYDFGFIKVPIVTEYKSILAEEFKDLILPYFINTNNIISNEGTYEQLGVAIEKNDVVIDVGANLGLFSVFAVQHKQAKKVYAFEPIRETISILKETINLNKSTHTIEVIEKGLSDKTTTMDIVFDKKRIDATSIMNDKQEGENSQKIELITLDQFVSQNNIEKIDFIKADIEGAERLMLSGAKKTLANFKPKLAICTYHYPDDKEVYTAPHCQHRNFRVLSYVLSPVKPVIVS